MKRYVTYSELRTRRRCPWKGHLEYDRLLSPVVKAPGLREGSIMDAGLNALYENHRLTGEHDLEVMLAAIQCAAEKEEARIAAGAQLFQEEWQAIRERTELLRDVARFYVPWAQAQDQGIQVVTRQFQGEVPVLAPSGRPSTKYQFRFKPDGIVVMAGQLWLWEDKAWKTIDRESLRLLTIDEQCGMYLWGLRQLIDRGEAPEAVKDAVAGVRLPRRRHLQRPSQEDPHHPQAAQGRLDQPGQGHRHDRRGLPPDARRSRPGPGGLRGDPRGAEGEGQHLLRAPSGAQERGRAGRDRRTDLGRLSAHIPAPHLQGR